MMTIGIFTEFKPTLINFDITTANLRTVWVRLSYPHLFDDLSHLIRMTVHFKAHRLHMDRLIQYKAKTIVGRFLLS